MELARRGEGESEGWVQGGPQTCASGATLLSNPSRCEIACAEEEVGMEEEVLVEVVVVEEEEVGAEHMEVVVRR